MSSYTRKPEQAIATCTVPGCHWKSIYFNKYYTDGREPLPANVRAGMALAAHRRIKHGRKQQRQKGCCG